MGNGDREGDVNVNVNVNVSVNVNRNGNGNGNNGDGMGMRREGNRRLKVLTAAGSVSCRGRVFRVDDQYSNMSVRLVR